MARVLPLRTEPILAVLERHDVEFIVVGGYAVNVHGVVRSTKDLDICPEPTEENLTKLQRNTVLRDFEGHRVRFSGYEDLIAMKKATGRPQDRIDLEDLKAARGEL